MMEKELPGYPKLYTRDNTVALFFTPDQKPIVEMTLYGTGNPLLIKPENRKRHINVDIKGAKKLYLVDDGQRRWAFTGIMLIGLNKTHRQEWNPEITDMKWMSATRAGR